MLGRIGRVVSLLLRKEDRKILCGCGFVFGGFVFVVGGVVGWSSLSPVLVMLLLLS